MKQIILACLFAATAIQLADAKRGSKGKGRGKGNKGEKGGKLAELCENAEEGSDMAFKCSCHAVMKVKRDERSEEQVALGKECLAKRKEKHAEKKESKGDAAAADGEKKDKKKGGWKSKVKACRRTMKMIKEGHASAEKQAWFDENCENMKGGKRKQRKPKGGDDSSEEADSEDGKSKGGKRRKRGRKARGPKQVLEANDQEESGVLYEEIFDIKDIDPEGKQFERVKRIHAECESSKMELILDVNSLLYAPNIGDKFRLMLATTLNDDGEPDGGVYDPLWEEKATRTNQFDYIMHGLVYRISGDEGDSVTRLEVYISYGGLLMRLNGEANSLSEIKIDQNVYLLLRKLSY